jgi:hypothetical protein
VANLRKHYFLFGIHSTEKNKKKKKKKKEEKKEKKKKKKKKKKKQPVCVFSHNSPHGRSCFHSISVSSLRPQSSPRQSVLTTTADWH